MRHPILWVAAGVLLIVSIPGFSAGSNETAAADDVLELRIMNRVNAQVDVENNPMIDEMARRTNTRITYEAPPIKDWIEIQNIVMASGDLPDIMYDWGLGENYQKWSEQGLFVDLDDYDVRDSGLYPNINANVTAKHWARAEVPAMDNHVFAVPRSHYRVSWGPVWRKDWLDNLGLDYPTTQAQFEATCDAFVRGDPDGNGQADTYCFTSVPGSSGPGTVRFLWAMNGYYNISRFNPAEGRLYLREAQPGYPRLINYLRDAYAKKWLDPEFITNKTYTDRDKFVQGRVGVYDGRQGELVVINGMDQTIYERVVWGPPPVGPSGEPYYNMSLPSVWGGWAVTHSSVQKTEKILDFLDYMYSMEGRILNTFGIQGEHYNSYDPGSRELDITTEQFEKVQSVTSIYMLFARANADGIELAEPGIGTPMYDVIESGLADYNGNTRAVWLPVANELDAEFRAFREARPELQNEMNEAEFRYIMGEISEQEWLSVVNRVLDAKRAAGLERALQQAQSMYAGVVD